MVTLLEGERTDYIAGTDLKVIQSSEVFSFSIDAVLLARFVRVPIQKGSILDLCTGNGVIPFLLTTRSKATIVGVDIQERLVHMAARSNQLNQLTDRVSFIVSDIKELELNQSFDVVTCNPPYFQTVSEKEINQNVHLAIARHEIHCTLEDVVRLSSKYVKQKGKVAFVHRPERLTDLMTMMREYRVEPKRIQFIHPKPEKEANMVLIEGIKDGSPGVNCLPPIVVYKADGTYSEQFLEIYEGRTTRQEGSINEAAK
ncbi:tRNA1(Val) (adenine(37)-N6)-methyltransferase [Bacillus suaedae]|uniref:tRNA1(Val) (Adenine(37)-N6)-methyltransferase n=1 Tax=Halalkalibacter suaedae TaxID=2822140 RepID=A0A941ARY4_9BACI|nr:tRNA1(Val) (adenine(37)-N6)-methyltransferase [Bacillus suaedae]MBP3953503.1 tRNA1(Val) (adenine(37)-N6)-methyltransferase [Bacillus suaedae]